MCATAKPKSKLVTVYAKLARFVLRYKVRMMNRIDWFIYVYSQENGMEVCVLYLSVIINRLFAIVLVAEDIIITYLAITLGYLSWLVGFDYLGSNCTLGVSFGLRLLRSFCPYFPLPGPLFLLILSLYFSIYLVSIFLWHKYVALVFSKLYIKSVTLIPLLSRVLLSIEFLPFKFLYLLCALS